MPPIGRSLGRGLLTVASSPVLLLVALMAPPVVWLVVLASGYEGPPAPLVYALAVPPISTVFDLGAGSSAVGLGPAFLVFIAVSMLVNLISSAVVVVMAKDALGAREPSMGDAFAAVMARLTDVVVASVLFAVIVGVASIFLVIPGIIAGFFLMFTLPAVLLDNVGAIDGLKRSATLVKNNLGPVLGLVIGVIVAAVIMVIASMILGVVPVIGQLASMLLAGAFFAYLTVVAVRVYQTLPRR